MTREEKAVFIDQLVEKLNAQPYFYLTDSSQLTVEKVNKFRRDCFRNGIEMKVVKNTLLKQAMDRIGTQYAPLYDSLKGTTAVLFAENGKSPAVLLKEFRKSNARPLLKAAYIDSAVFVGDDQIDTLIKLKSKFELVGEVIGLLQSPAKNVISALSSGGNKLAGILKTLEER
jgi:large subunit ribosomal protein L10